MANLKKYRAVAIDDVWHSRTTCSPQNKVLGRRMTRFAIAHTCEEYDGDHTNRVADRIEMHVLPFFSTNLEFSAKTAAGVSTRR